MISKLNFLAIAAFVAPAAAVAEKTPHWIWSGNQEDQAAYFRLEFDAPADLIDSLSAYVPQLGYRLEDLARLSDEEIRQLAEDGILQLFMLLLKHGRLPDAMMPKLLNWLDLWRAASALISSR